MSDLYDSRSAEAMLLTESEPFDSENHIYELKLDGIRCLAYLEPGKVDLRNKRNKYLTDIYPELSEVHQQVKTRVILDGELVVMDNGRPDFYELQRRSLMTDKFKIELSARQRPVRLVIYDILYLDHESLLDKPLMERKRLLEEHITESDSLAISRYILEKGKEFYQLVAAQNLEGIVAKKKESIYQMGKRSKYWIKFKKLEDGDFIICGYVPNEQGGIKSVQLAIYDQGELINQGHVAMGISKQDEKIILKHSIVYESDYPFKEGQPEKEAQYFEPTLVCKVEYMMRSKHGLRQPVFKGLRNDKEPSACTTEQFIN
jgi:bifunctional non-homologous end joining protein LigD